MNLVNPTVEGRRGISVLRIMLLLFFFTTKIIKICVLYVFFFFSLQLCTYRISNNPFSSFSIFFFFVPPPVREISINPLRWKVIFDSENG